MARSTPRPWVKSSAASSKSSFVVITTRAWRSGPGHAFSFTYLQTGADVAGADCHGKLRGEQADAPADRVDKNRLPGLEAVERRQHVVAGQRLNGERRSESKGMASGSRISMLAATTAFSA